MDLAPDNGTQTPETDMASVRRSGKVLITFICGRSRAVVLRDRVPARSFPFQGHSGTARRTAVPPLGPRAKRGQALDPWGHGSRSSSRRPALCASSSMTRLPTNQVTCPVTSGWPMNDANRAHTDASRAWQSSSRKPRLHSSISVRPSSPAPSRAIRSVEPPLPARPENETVATIAPREASSAQISSRVTSSPQAARRRAA
jgi:hypothetical protein